MIKVNNLSKIYKPQCVGIRGLFDRKKEITAVKNITFSVKKGECVGIIGKNGSGKSTLLKLLCSITAPTTGDIEVNGRISSLLELGTGFNPEYTGVENVYLNGAVMGMSRSETRALLPEIQGFAEIGDFIYSPVKTYSDGMFLRLAFACAVAQKPDILIVDEALAVGDFAFRQKCFDKIRQMKAVGTTVLMVSHDIDTIRRFCTRAIWLENGEVKADGAVDAVSSAYMECMVNGGRVDSSASAVRRYGSNVGAIISAEVAEHQQNGRDYRLTAEVDIPRNADLSTLALSVAFKNAFGLDVCVYSTADTGISFEHYGKTEVVLDYNCILCSGEYSLAVSLEDRGKAPIAYYDYAQGAKTLKVTADKEYFGTCHNNVIVNVK